MSLTYVTGPISLLIPSSRSSRSKSDYEIFEDQVLGSGGMGTVYRGRQISLGRDVAIKVIRESATRNSDFLRRFRREAKILAQVIDGHVVQVFGAGEWKGRPFYAMERVDGEDLAALAERKDRFLDDEILHVAEGVASALRAAWKYRIVHLDIKPANILIARDGTVKVADFGLARSLAAESGRADVIEGTYQYLSPEQALGGEMDIRSDVYSLGVVLYELAAGKAPFPNPGNSATSLLYQHVHAVPVPPRQAGAGISRAVERIILRCMARARELRYATPDELLAAIRQARALLQRRQGKGGFLGKVRLAAAALGLYLAVSPGGSDPSRSREEAPRPLPSRHP